MNKKEKGKFTKETIKLLFEAKDIRSEILILHLSLALE